MDFLLVSCLIVIFIIVVIIFSEFFIPRKGINRERKTVYDDSIIGLTVTIGISIIIGVISPFIVYSFGKNNQTDTIVLYIGSIIGAIISICGAILAVILTFKKQKEKQDDELRVSTKLKLKNLYSYLYVYYMNHTLMGMGTEKLLDEKLIYNYARDFIEFRGHLFKELSETSEKLFDIFDKNFEEEYQVCIHVLNYEKAKSTKFMAALLNIHDIFKDELAREALSSPGVKELVNEYEYTAFQVFLVLEAHINSKVLEFNKEVKSFLEDL
ncbi:hypothetical protein [Neobacillus niacini]|uniref:hypothetical protein n=1 Tax=Neobacillus niacini TaxID=86668 RepID=UPI0005EDF8A3|nr:hypothetical protein [Neobacillus niacini]